MSKNLNVWKVPDDICLKMRLLAVGRHVSMAHLLADLVEKEWNQDKTAVGKLEKRKMKRIIRSWR